MPDLDFMILADYVRSEGGVLHMIAAGIDNIYTTAVPSARMVGVGLRVLFADDEPVDDMTISITFSREGEQPALAMNGKLTALTSPVSTLAGMPRGVAGALNFLLPLPAYGIFSLAVTIGNVHARTMAVAITPPPPEL